MPDISTINTVAVADIDKFQSITFADGQKVNNQDVSLIVDAHTLIATATADEDATLTFHHGVDGVVFDDTYDVYEFVFTNMHPATDNVHFQFQTNSVGASGFAQTVNSTAFEAYHSEADDSVWLDYTASYAQGGSSSTYGGTAYQSLMRSVGNDSDQSCSGILTFYTPDMETYLNNQFLHHFHSVAQGVYYGDYSIQFFVGGYFRSSSTYPPPKIDEIGFKFSSGNMDTGEIKMYGLAKS
jgi:hypothetical protein